jgi:hypothetical protein
MSLARLKRDRVLAAQTITAATAPVTGAVASPAAALPSAAGGKATPADRAAAEIALRLTHDLRRLKEIKSIDRKIEAKREMLPQYNGWVVGVMSADAGVGTGIAADVVPTCMVWSIDVGAYDDALAIGEFLLRHHVAMPKRYERDVATILVEEIADAALKVQNTGKAFPLDVLSTANDLTADEDIHDQVRAKLLKAIGIEQLRVCEGLVAEESSEALTATLATLREAQRLNDRVGVKDRIKRADKLLAAVSAAAPTTDTGGNPAA